MKKRKKSSRSEHGSFIFGLKPLGPEAFVVQAKGKP